MDAILDFLRRNFEEILGRASEPLRFRLLMMPIVVTILAIRAHLRDVREGHPLYLGAFFTSRSERRRLLRSGLKDFGKVFVVACVLDTAYQILFLRAFYPGQMLSVAVACAIVPYFVIRGPVTRIANSTLRWWRGDAERKAGPAKAGPERHEGQE
jgi:hypothetical protein